MDIIKDFVYNKSMQFVEKSVCVCVCMCAHIHMYIKLGQFFNLKNGKVNYTITEITWD